MCAAGHIRAGRRGAARKLARCSRDSMHASAPTPATCRRGMRRGRHGDRLQGNAAKPHNRHHHPHPSLNRHITNQHPDARRRWTRRGTAPPGTRHIHARGGRRSAWGTRAEGRHATPVGVHAVLARTVSGALCWRPHFLNLARAAVALVECLSNFDSWQVEQLCGSLLSCSAATTPGRARRAPRTPRTLWYVQCTRVPARAPHGLRLACCMRQASPHTQRELVRWPRSRRLFPLGGGCRWWR